jgi:hypothetical protein
MKPRGTNKDKRKIQKIFLKDIHRVNQDLNKTKMIPKGIHQVKFPDNTKTINNGTSKVETLGTNYFRMKHKSTNKVGFQMKIKN